ncbi:hypothetical protein KUL72_14375 [Bradyrhizobium arachidis]|uniref:hypothetical protein n=1 Tax=Bradyrhizobium TaxID=374 RepID=UPI00188AA20D|nr:MULTISPECIES: hypothetical protein [Bradyrhizobium]MDN4981787.1 hypothetical protein [Bradyrhizobium sp. WYCCWR 13022]UVO39445.1 hypothetical protein KUL72_14375 [Bradyrhizobium arachidis]
MEDIQKRQRHIEDRVFLIDVLEREGHITLDEQAALKFERQLLALQIEQQTRLLLKARI